MPYEVSTFTLPGGVQATRADGSGVITREDAELLMKRIIPGGASFGQPFLVLTQKITRLSAEARGIFANNDDPDAENAWCAVVVTNPVIRVTINFLVRVSRTKRLKLFSAEPDAIRWLDERVGARR